MLPKIEMALAAVVVQNEAPPAQNSFIALWSWTAWMSRYITSGFDKPPCVRVRALACVFSQFSTFSQVYVICEDNASKHCDGTKWGCSGKEQLHRTVTKNYLERSGWADAFSFDEPPCARALTCVFMQFPNTKQAITFSSSLHDLWRQCYQHLGWYKRKLYVIFWRQCSRKLGVWGWGWANVKWCSSETERAHRVVRCV